MANTAGLFLEMNGCTKEEVTKTEVDTVQDLKGKVVDMAQAAANAVRDNAGTTSEANRAAAAAAMSGGGDAIDAAAGAIASSMDKKGAASAGDAATAVRSTRLFCNSCTRLFY